MAAPIFSYFILTSNSDGSKKCSIFLTTHSTHFVYGYTASEEGRKEMFYLTMHSTHFIYGYKDHSDSDGSQKCLIF